MPNQEDSQPPTSSTGSIGPVEFMWREFCRVNEIDDTKYTDVQLESMRFIHYTSAMQMYNAFVLCLRVDKTGEMMVSMTAAMKHDMETYFASENRNIH